MQWKSDSFVDRLNQCVGGPWHLYASLNEPDNEVIQLSHNDTKHPWSNPSGFLDFLDSNHHRRLLRCLMGRTPWEKKRAWSLETLTRETRPPSHEALEEALTFCHEQEFAFHNHTREQEKRILAWYRTLVQPLSEEKESERLALFPEKIDTWYGDDRLIDIPNFGPTLEWIVQATLQREHHALARRHVSLGGLGQLGDIDVLAFLEDGRVAMVECKSSTKRITDEHIERFLKRARIFTPADVALLLIDSDDPHQMQQRQSQLHTALFREYREYDSTLFRTLHLGGSHIYHLHDNVYVADTGGGIQATLKFVLLYQRSHSSH